MVLAENGGFWPKIAVMAENNSYSRKFSYDQNFVYGQISAFLKPILTVTVFRQTFSFGHTLRGSEEGLSSQLATEREGISKGHYVQEIEEGRTFAERNRQ